MRTAHVGYTDSDSDFERVQDAEYRVALQAFGLDGDERVDLLEDADKIDLNAGRDFLAERQRYTVVVLHRLWKYDWKSAGMEGKPDFRTSPEHSAERWRARLVATGARFIITYAGTGTEIDRWYLGDLPGYRLAFSDERLATHLYERLNP